MTALTFERYRAAIVEQTELLRSAITDADMTVPVPSCPGWNVGQLVRHTGGGQRWVAETIRTLATTPPSDTAMRDLSSNIDEDPNVLVPWLAETCAELVAALDQTGPDAELWTPVPGAKVQFFARRFAHETAIHRADAVLALGQRFALSDDLAVDGVDEWLELGVMPFHFDVHPWMRELMGPGRTVRLYATDAKIHWVMDMTGQAMAWRRSDEDCAVTLSGPVTELLLAIYKRRAPDGLQIDGDRAWLEFWLERVSFG